MNRKTLILKLQNNFTINLAFVTTKKPALKLAFFAAIIFIVFRPGAAIFFIRRKR